MASGSRKKNMVGEVLGVLRSVVSLQDGCAEDAIALKISAAEPPARPDHKRAREKDGACLQHVFQGDRSGWQRFAPGEPQGRQRHGNGTDQLETELERGNRKRQQHSGQVEVPLAVVGEITRQHKEKADGKEEVPGVGRGVDADLDKSGLDSREAVSYYTSRCV